MTTGLTREGRRTRTIGKCDELAFVVNGLPAMKDGDESEYAQVDIGMFGFSNRGRGLDNFRQTVSARYGGIETILKNGWKIALFHRGGGIFLIGKLFMSKARVARLAHGKKSKQVTLVLRGIYPK